MSSSPASASAIYWPSWRVKPQEIFITEFCHDGHVQTTTEGKLPICFCYPMEEKQFIFSLFHTFCRISTKRSQLKAINRD